jgi:hypothetical protein
MLNEKGRISVDILARSSGTTGSAKNLTHRTNGCTYPGYLPECGRAKDQAKFLPKL